MASIKLEAFYNQNHLQEDSVAFVRLRKAALTDSAIIRRKKY
jgi:hypothetical protein